MPDTKKPATSSIRAKGWGVSIFANGVTPGGWIWLISIVVVGCAVIFFGLEARAAHREQLINQLLMTCIIATDDKPKMPELVNDGSFCNKMARWNRN